MATWARDAHVNLRPHAKSHKSAFVARLQLEAGAIGLSCAKLSEVERLCARLVVDGYTQRPSFLITSPLATSASTDRLADVRRDADVMVVVDCVEGVEELAHVFTTVHEPLDVLCDVDVGLGRTGVRDAAHALDVVGRIVDAPGLRFAGVQGYGGHLQHIEGWDVRRRATRESVHRLSDVIESLESHGHTVQVRTGGGTGTSTIDLADGVFNEIQPGSYVFMDREYRDALGGDEPGTFHQSLLIAATVISANQAEFVTVDAGLKSMATDAGEPLVTDSRDRYHFFGDEHGMVTTSDRPRSRGERVELVPPHCDPTVDKYDYVWLARGDMIVGVADVCARGCSQ